MGLQVYACYTLNASTISIEGKKTATDFIVEGWGVGHGRGKLPT